MDEKRTVEGVRGRHPSLIELFVALVIVSGTLTMFSPVIAAQGENDRPELCVSNLRQIGVAMLLYARDNDDYLPAPGDGLRGGTNWTHLNSKTGESKLLDPYLQNGGHSLRYLWVCPNLTERSDRRFAKDDRRFYQNFPRSYSMNYFLTSPGRVDLLLRNKKKEVISVTDPDSLNPALTEKGFIPLIRLPQGIVRSKILRAEQTVLLFEGIPLKVENGEQAAAYAGASWDGVAGFFPDAAACRAAHRDKDCQASGIMPFHGLQNNYLYCDGHLQAKQPKRKGWVPTASDPGEFLVRHCRSLEAPCP
jgi:prepilin-type processing-associated H-X9-DG protein